MRAVVQRVSRASVRVDGEVVGSCGKGLVALAAARRDDTEQSAKRLADKVAGLRVFNDANGKMNLSLADVGGSVLAISNFTLYGDAEKSRRPSFVEAAPFAKAEALFESFVRSLREMGCSTEQGIFGAHMELELVNDGPVTIILET